MIDQRMDIQNVKSDLIKKTKKEKITSLNAYLANFKKSKMEFGEQVWQVYKPNFEEDILKLKQEIEEDNSIAYTRDWNWYYNGKNLSNEKVIQTRDFIEGKRKDQFESLYFFNLLFRQIDNLKDNLDTPIDYLESLKNLPFDELQKHILFGLILFWHGGYPVNNMDESYNSILKLIEKEFLSFPGHTSEKEFCAENLETHRQFNELAAHVGASMKGVTVLRPGENRNSREKEFPESHYFHLVLLDFEDLPNYIIQRGIIWRFENTSMKEDEYNNWQIELVDFLNSVPQQYRIKALEKGVEYAKLVYKYHLDNECNNPKNCSLNESWERRITLAEAILSNSTQSENRGPEKGLGIMFTLNEQVLSKTDFIRLVNVLYELRAFKKENGQLPDKKDVIEAFGKFVGKDLKNFHPDLNKAFEKSNEANLKIFDTLKDKQNTLWEQKNYR